jgi:hypothetical protein
MCLQNNKQCFKTLEKTDDKSNERENQDFFIEKGR